MLAGRIGGLRYGVRFLFFLKPYSVPTSGAARHLLPREGGRIGFRHYLNSQKFERGDDEELCAPAFFSYFTPLSHGKGGRENKGTNDTAVSLFV